MASPSVTTAAALCLLALTGVASAQQAISLTASGSPRDAAIEQSRLFQRNLGTANTPLSDDEIALGESASSEDDSFGEQAILKSQPRVRTFVITGDASIFYTDNAALSRRGTRDDSFLVAHAAASWLPRVSRTVEAQMGISAATFRYADLSELDFTNLTVGAGVFWTPERLRGVTFFARYDFIELLNRRGNEILRDHEFTVGAQRVFVLGRSHAFTIGALGMAGIAEPDSAERSQLGLFAGYRLQLTRHLETEIFYRAAAHFYTDGGRLDGNQVFSWTLRYRFTPWAEANGFFSFGNNRSDAAVFDYDVLTAGAGVGATIRF